MYIIYYQLAVNLYKINVHVNFSALALVVSDPVIKVGFCDI